ncbi:hypothetical protein RF11_08635 [Thelohanellus kitauei]|uniref:Uncharacterized protein n=1 Tax=Thelohanellus kitauei TaxID=669202 RepID=A0A0C2MN04_THEKT|nr:hypothetical protein RF11_08635 [Thelohanellus kitauei]
MSPEGIEHSPHRCLPSGRLAVLLRDNYLSKNLVFIYPYTSSPLRERSLCLGSRRLTRIGHPTADTKCHVKGESERNRTDICSMLTEWSPYCITQRFLLSSSTSGLSYTGISLTYNVIEIDQSPIFAHQYQPVIQVEFSKCFLYFAIKSSK